MIIREYNNIHKIKHLWNEVWLTSNRTPNPFTSFIPNRIYYDVFRLNPHRFFLSPRFIYAEDGNDRVLVPIIISRKTKTITEFAPLDYYDVVLSGASAVVTKVFDWIKSNYPGYIIRLTRINEKSTLASCLDLSRSKEEKCVKIMLGEQYDSYFSSIPKHQRQNVRTAYNKIAKENIAFTLDSFHCNQAIPSAIKKACLRIYEDRKAVKNKPVSQLKHFYQRVSFPVFKMMTKMETGRLFVLSFNGEPVALMAGAYADDDNCFTVPILAANIKYLKYSPGIILINEVVKVLIEEGTNCLDLARGTEPYKYAMGGIDHMNYTIQLPAKE